MFRKVMMQIMRLPIRQKFFGNYKYKAIHLHTLLLSHTWIVEDIGLDNDHDGIIEQSMLASCQKNITLDFKNNQVVNFFTHYRCSKCVGTFPFDWSIDLVPASLVLHGDSCLMKLRNRWRISKLTKTFIRLFYDLQFSTGTVRICMILKVKKTEQNNRISYL